METIRTRQLEAEIDRLRAVLIRVRDWDAIYDSMPDTLAAAIGDALNEQFRDKEG